MRKELASRLNSLAKQGGFAQLPVAAGVEAGIIAITNLVLDQTRFSDIKPAASAMQGPLTDVVNALKTENVAFAAGINGKVAMTEGELGEALATTHRARRQMTFVDMVQARRIMESMSMTDPSKAAVELNATLVALLNANNAIATAGTGGFLAAVNDLVARAQAIAIALQK
jgi:hypothetical protein